MRNIGLFSVPRSGSTWLGELINSSPEVSYKFQPNFAYSFKEELLENSTKLEIGKFFESLNETNDDFVNGRISISGQQKNYNFKKSKTTTLCFKETHYLNIMERLLEASPTKIIGLVRSPFSVINSWLNIPKEFSPEWEISQEWKTANLKNKGLKTHFFGYDKWKEACFTFLKLKALYPNQFHLINYDDLLTHTTEEVEQLFKFIGITFTTQTANFITQSKSNQSDDAYSVFKKKANDFGWQSSLPDFIQKEIKNDPDFVKLNKLFQWI